MMSSSELTTSNDDTNNINHSIDPLQIEEARRYQEIAERAERKAAERAATVEPSTFASSNNSNTTTKFLSKQEREKLALERLESKRQEVMTKNLQAEKDHNRFVSGLALEEKKKNEKIRAEMDLRERELRKAEENKESVEIDHEIKSIREHYLGQGEKKKKVNKPSDKFARIFQFDWKDEDDTARNDQNPLYNNRVKINTLFGRGYLAGIERQQQRKDSNFLVALSEKRMSEIKETDTGSAGRVETMERSQARFLASEALKRKFDEDVGSSSDKKDNLHWSEKQLHQMSERDWRIFREDFDIRVQGARDCLPLRNWEEARLPSQLLKAVRDANYEKPSPIQRQAIPVGMLKRDLIGLAETGSGKTAAFLIPLLAYLLAAPLEHIERVAGQGPLALIMAPTRELAQQIEEECIKLAKYTSFITANVVGGQSIEDQGFKLRKGVHIVIGTPGRLCDCLQNNYLVLNQCNYVVMDEADRMVDMGFEEQVLEVLDGMGSILKSENEDVAETQLSTQSIRITSMFSATMSSEIERLAKTYLRHPVIVKIGDEETGKNKRIEQRVMFLSEGQKKNKLIEELNKLGNQEKVSKYHNCLFEFTTLIVKYFCRPLCLSISKSKVTSWDAFWMVLVLNRVTYYIK